MTIESALTYEQVSSTRGSNIVRRDAIALPIDPDSSLETMQRCEAGRQVRGFLYVVEMEMQDSARTESYQGRERDREYHRVVKGLSMRAI